MPEQEVQAPAPSTSSIDLSIEGLERSGYQVIREGYVGLVDGTLHHLNVRLQKGGALPSKAAILMSGEVVTLEAARKSFMEAHRERYGSLTTKLAMLVEADYKEAVDVAIWFDPAQSDFQDFKRAVQELDPDSIVRDEEPFIAFLSVTPERLLSESDVSRSNSSLQAYGVGRAMDYACQGTNLAQINANYSDPNRHGAAQWSNTDVSFNARGYFGAKIKVGINELFQEDGVWSGHQALSDTNGGGEVRYQVTPPSCASDSDCLSGICKPNKSGNDQCVRDHGSVVASRISHASSAQGNHASSAELYVSNYGALYGSSQDRMDALIERYNYLHREGVRLVNESWGMGTLFDQMDDVFPTFHDALNTWYSVKRNMTFVRASGNGLPRNETDCHALNSICVGAVDGRCGYDEGDYLDSELVELSAWRNPYNTYSPIPCHAGPNCVESLTSFRPDAQVERPDVVAEGNSGLRMDIHKTNATGYVKYPYSGYPAQLPLSPDISVTSFAAPVVTGMIALCQEAGKVSSRNYKRNKLYVRIAALGFHALEGLNTPIYPTYTSDPGQSEQVNRQYSQDYRAGAGIIHAEDYFDWCSRDYSRGNNPGADKGEGSSTTSLTSGEPVPREYITGIPVGNPVSSGEHGDLYLSQTLKDPAYGSGYLGETIATFRNAKKGKRVRAVVVYNACPDINTNDPSDHNPDDTLSSAPSLMPSYDLDLILCGDGVCEAVSDSKFDTVEGFDVRIDRDYNALELKIIWKNGAKNCFGSENHDYDWAWHTWG